MVLAARGVKHGDRVAWWSETSIQRRARVLRAGEHRRHLRPHEPAVQRRRGQGHPRSGRSPPRHPRRGAQGRPRDHRAAGPRRPSTVDLPEINEYDPEVIFCTSGTTGTPKGCVLSHRCNRLRTSAQAGGGEGAVMSIFPQFHWGGWSFTHSAWYGGDELALVDGGDTTALLEAIHTRQVRPLLRHPRHLAAHPRGRPLRLRPELPAPGQHRHVGDAARLLHAIHEAFPHTTTKIGYGATEAGGVVHAHLRRHRPQARLASGCRRRGCTSASSTASCGCAARWRSAATSATPRRRPTPSSTAGTAPATWSSATTRATSPSSGRART